MKIATQRNLENHIELNNFYNEINGAGGATLSCKDYFYYNEGRLSYGGCKLKNGYEEVILSEFIRKINNHKTNNYTYEIY